MFALFPLIFVLAVIAIPLVIHIASGFSHADDAWNADDYQRYYNRFRGI